MRRKSVGFCCSGATYPSIIHFFAKYISPVMTMNNRHAIRLSLDIFHHSRPRIHNQVTPLILLVCLA